MGSDRLLGGLNYIITVALKEDIGRADITTRLVIPKAKKVEAIIMAKESGIVCGIDLARLVFKTLDKNIRFMAYVRDGDKVRKRKILARVYGCASNILSAERVALNFLSMLSGIATKTRAYVDALKPYKPKILDTRKTLPGLRALEKYAVKVGGGCNHRLRLDEMVLIKDNHIRVAGDRLCVRGLNEVKNKISPDVKIEIEVKTLSEFKKVLEMRPDIIMLDNMSIDQVKKAVRIRNDLSPSTYHLIIPKLEVSGNITLDNVKKYARCGVEFISVGSLTKDIKSLDISLDIL